MINSGYYEKEYDFDHQKVNEWTHNVNFIIQNYVFFGIEYKKK